MPAGRHPKTGPKRHPQVTLRGRTLKAMEALAAKMGEGDELPTAVRAGLDDWLTTESASVLFQSYGLDLAEIIGEQPRPRSAEIVKLEPRTDRANEGEQEAENDNNLGIS